MDKIRTVCIPACDNHDGWLWVNVNLLWICPVCGAPRGEIKQGRSYDGSMALICDTWDNPCGHIDKYADVRKEAKKNGLNGINRTTKYVVNLSGGKDSTALLLMLLEKNLPIDYILFADTGKDFPQMITHLKELAEFIKKKYPKAPQIITLKCDKSFDYLMFKHIKTKGKNIGKCGYGWATMRNRWCTSTLKTAEINKFCKSLNSDVVSYIGIATDEPNRLKSEVITYKGKDKQKHTITKAYPLDDWNITEAAALQYCYDNGFTWGGLYKHFDRVSCWCCPLKNLKELKILYQYYPELWQELKQMDERSFNHFRADYTVAQLEERFKRELKEGGAL